MGLMLDWARTSKSKDFEQLLIGRARDFYLSDRDVPVHYEPSGEDFLSPALAEADLMRRVLPDFSTWFKEFLPDVSSLQPVTSPDPSDGKLAHFDGLNLSRAWMLGALGFTELAEAHASAGLAAVTGEHYEGGHWLGTFAVYLLTAPRLP
jgi:hypothetical protein